MRFWRAALAVLAAAGILSGPAFAADIKIIANPSVEVSSITVEQLRMIYLRVKGTLNGGGRLEPVLLRSGPAHQTFLREYIGRSGPALETYYRSLLFSGKASVPEFLPNEAAMIDYVARTKGAIGYVSATTPTDRVRTIEIK